MARRTMAKKLEMQRRMTRKKMRRRKPQQWRPKGLIEVKYYISKMAGVPKPLD